MKIYIDTCVYIDYWQQTRQKYRDLFEESNRLFTRCQQGEFEVVYSDWVEYECAKKGYSNQLNSLLATFPKKSYVKKTKADEYAAKAMSSNFDDALHVILAINKKANILTSRNERDFYEFFDILKHNGIEFIEIGIL